MSVNFDRTSMQLTPKFTWVNKDVVDVSKVTPGVDVDPLSETLTSDVYTLEKQKGFSGSNDATEFDGCDAGGNSDAKDDLAKKSIDLAMKPSGEKEPEVVNGGSRYGLERGFTDDSETAGTLDGVKPMDGNPMDKLGGDSGSHVSKLEDVYNDESLSSKEQNVGDQVFGSNKSVDLDVSIDHISRDDREEKECDVMDTPESIPTNGAKVVSPSGSQERSMINGRTFKGLGKRKKNEDEFCASDLVWGKVRSHPWWPGQIFGPSDASALAKKHRKPNTHLIAYFDQSFAWHEKNKLKPFWQNFSLMEKQSNQESFQYAVECALDEASRRVEFGLACQCLGNNVYDELKTQAVSNAGILEESSRKEGGDRYYTVSSFEPTKFVNHIATLARSPGTELDRLKIMNTRAELLAFYRWKGRHSMAEYHLSEGLYDADSAFAGDINNLTKLVVDGTIDSRNVDLGSSSKEVSKESVSISQKRNRRSIDCSSPAKKERRLTDLLARDSPLQNGKKISEANESQGSVRFSCKKRKTDDMVSGYVKEAPKVGERIRNAANLLSQMSMISWIDNGSKVSPADYYSFDVGEIFSQLLSVAIDPLNSSTSVDFVFRYFSDFRKSVFQASDSDCKKQSSSPGDEDKSEAKVSNEKFKKERSTSDIEGSFDYKVTKDSYWTDRIISDPEEKAFPDETKAASESRLRKTGPESSMTKVSASDDKANEESSPAALILNFTDAGSIPSEANLNEIFSRYGPLVASGTEVLKKNKRCKVVFKKRIDADAAFSSSGKFKVFGPSLVSYRLNYHPALGKTPSSSSKPSKKAAVKDGTA